MALLRLLVLVPLLLATPAYAHDGHHANPSLLAKKKEAPRPDKKKEGFLGVGIKGKDGSRLKIGIDQENRPTLKPIVPFR